MPIMKGRGIHWHPQTAELPGTTTRVDAVLSSWLGRALLRSRRAWGMLCFVWWWSVANAEMKEHVKEHRKVARVAPVAGVLQFRLCQKERSTYFFKCVFPQFRFDVPAVSPSASCAAGRLGISVRCEVATMICGVTVNQDSTAFEKIARSLTLNYYVVPQITARPSSHIYAPQRLAYFCLSDPSGVRVSVPHHINPIIRVSTITSQQQ